MKGLKELRIVLLTDHKRQWQSMPGDTEDALLAPIRTIAVKGQFEFMLTFPRKAGGSVWDTLPCDVVYDTPVLCRNM